jgi:HSP20 family protein
MLARTECFTRSLFSQVFGTSPVADVFVGKTGFQIQLELPGVKREDIDIRIANGCVNVEAVKKFAEPEGAKLARAERAFGSFSRVFRLPESAKLDKLEAVLSQGVLTLSIPKKETSHVEIKVK